MQYTYPEDLLAKWGPVVRREAVRLQYKAGSYGQHEPLRRRCTTCGAQGITITPDGQHHMCTGCKGFKDVPMTDDELRLTYAELRTAACAALSTTPAAFDGLVALGCPPGSTPSQWVRVALSVCKSTGVFR